MKLGALVSVVIMAVSPLVTAQTDVCNNRDLAILKDKAWRYRQFCTYYLSVKRAKSPISDFSAGRLTDLCRCVIPRNQRPAVLRIPTVPPRRKWACVNSNLAKLKRHYKESRGFCNYWESNARLKERLPAVPGFSYIDTSRACACFSNNAVVTTTTTRSTTTTTTTITSTTDTTSSASTTFEDVQTTTSEESTTSTTFETTSATSTEPTTTADPTSFITSTISDTTSSESSTLEITESATETALVSETSSTTEADPTD